MKAIVMLLRIKKTIATLMMTICATTALLGIGVDDPVATAKNWNVYLYHSPLLSKDACICFNSL